MVLTLLAAGAGCGDDASSGGAGGSGGSGGGPSTGGSGGSGGDPSTGGAGGSGGSGGGSGGSGGGSACIAPADVPFAIVGDELCVVAAYDAPGLSVASYGPNPTWGRHGGPLTLSATGSNLTVSRWALDGQSLTPTASNLAVAGVPDPVYWGGQVADVADAASVTSWTGASFDTQGALVAFEGTDFIGDLTTGVYGLAALDARVVYTGLSAANGPTNATPGVYVADLASIEDGFANSLLVEAFGEATGPVTLDADGRAFAIMTKFSTGTQEARSYPSTIGTTTTPIVGTSLFEIPGFGGAFAAVAPLGASPGLLVYQPNAPDFSLVTPLVQRYGASGAPVGEPEDFLTLEDDQTPLTFMTDDDGRLWVGVNEGAASTFYVLARP